MTQSIHQTHPPRLSSQDVWLLWPDTYRPPCPICATETIGLLDRGRYIAGSLRIHTTVEPCGCDVSEHVQTMQTAAIAAGAIL